MAQHTGRSPGFMGQVHTIHMHTIHMHTIHIIHIIHMVCIDYMLSEFFNKDFNKCV
jgi:hypothetical protein